MNGFEHKTVIIVGGGPAGLMAAEVLAKAGCRVHVYDRKPSVARKFLMAGRGGLNLTHSEDMQHFKGRYGAAEGWMSPMLHGFTPQQLREWCEGLGQKTFVGSSGRVFPETMKASPLLRSWLTRLEEYGVKFHLQRTWAGWDEQSQIVFHRPDGGTETVQANAVLLALGGASWPGLGSDGSWMEFLQQKHIAVHTLRPANCGFVCAWSDIFKEKFSGQPMKGLSLSHDGKTVRGEAMISREGIEGGVVYALSAPIRTQIENEGRSLVHVDLKPDSSREEIETKLSRSRGKQSFTTYLQKTLSLSPLFINLLRESGTDIQTLSPADMASLIKAVPIVLMAPFSIDRAISSAGGVAREELDDHLQLKKIDGTFVAGEMIDWEAPTGGYLLQGCFATGKRAADGILDYLKR